METPFLFKLLIHLSERERSIFYPWVHSSNGYNSQACAKRKSEAKNSIWVSPSNTGTFIYRFLETLAASWIGSEEPGLEPALLFRMPARQVPLLALWFSISFCSVSLLPPLCILTAPAVRPSPWHSQCRRSALEPPHRPTSTFFGTELASLLHITLPCVSC